MKQLFIFLISISFTSVLSAQDYCGRAASSYKEGKYEDAIKFYNVCMKETGQNHRNEVGNAEKCRDLLLKASTFLEINDYAHAIQMYRELLTINPDDPSAKKGIELLKDQSDGKPEPPPATPPAPAPSRTSVQTPGKRMEVRVTNMELIENGKKYLMEFLLINHGDDIKSYTFCARALDAIRAAAAYDNMGEQSDVHPIMFGNQQSDWCIPQRLPGDTPIKVKLVISGFSPQATHFTRIRLFGECGIPGAEGEYIFKNVPIR